MIDDERLKTIELHAIWAALHQFMWDITLNNNYTICDKNTGRFISVNEGDRLIDWFIRFIQKNGKLNIFQGKREKDELSILLMSNDKIREMMCPHCHSFEFYKTGEENKVKCHKCGHIWEKPEEKRCSRCGSLLNDKTMTHPRDPEKVWDDWCDNCYNQRFEIFRPTLGHI